MSLCPLCFKIKRGACPPFLKIREKTVKNHLQKIFHKLGIHKRLNLAVDLLDEMSDFS
ncbi:MAG: LuxR C-terminal-related transcriptional regulator [Thermodesulfobacteriota bacterium]